MVEAQLTARMWGRVSKEGLRFAGVEASLWAFWVKVRFLTLVVSVNVLFD